MCQSMVNLQSPTTEIRQGKKEEERKKQNENIMVCPITQGDHNNHRGNCISLAQLLLPICINHNGNYNHHKQFCQYVTIWNIKTNSNVKKTKYNTGIDNTAGNWTTRGYANLRIANSRTGNLAYWSTQLDKSRTAQLADVAGSSCSFKYMIMWT